MTNSADPDQLASLEANRSGSTLFAKTGHVVFRKRRANIHAIENIFHVEPNSDKFHQDQLTECPALILWYLHMKKKVSFFLFSQRSYTWNPRLLLRQTTKIQVHWFA